MQQVAKWQSCKKKSHVSIIWATSDNRCT